MINKKASLFLTSVLILVDIKADLRSNSELLEVNSTQRATKINVLDDCAYPVFRLNSHITKL
jgi:hypothetical protein